MNIFRNTAFAAAGLAASVLSAETPATRTTIVVRADAQSGRLVRSVVVAPRVIGVAAQEKAEAGIAVTPALGLASGSLADLIDAIALRNNVEAPLVHSVIKAESNYNPVALSPKGAQGLMQLIPSTARRFGVTNSFNAQDNIEGGVKYLKYLMELYKNDYVKVIAAYNAGEGAVAKYGGIPPYAETINYVYRVGKNLKAARQFAEQKAKIVPLEAKKQAVDGEMQASVIQSSVAADGKVYYKTQ